jgi:trehalose-6-phosphatase
VAEYGAATCGLLGEDVRTTLSSAQATAATRWRDRLARAAGVELGSDHTFVVRAWTRDARGRRSAVPVELLAPEMDVRVIHGDEQTDLVPAGIDKGTGLRALSARLGLPAELALAFGDTAEDLPMFARAALARAPANAARPVRSSGVRATRHPYQAGLAEAVQELIGHVPGGCPVCVAHEAGSTRQALLRILSARERGTVGMALTLAALSFAGARGR